MPFQLPTNFRLTKKQTARIQIDKFDGGVNTLFSETRLKKNEAKEALNMMLIEDGIWDKRWGTAQYGGVSFTNTIDGFTEYRKTDGTRELIVVADGYAYVVDPDAGTKTAISGATFTSGHRAFFLQIKSELYVANGEDALARYNGTSLAVYSSISAPGTITLTRGAGLSAGSYTYYYQATAVNTVGETLASAEASITVNKPRDTWVLASNEYVDADWADVSGAISYVVYFSDTSGYEVKLMSVGGSAFRDDGSQQPNPYISPPLADTTGGPKFTHMTISGNRIWGTGDPDNEFRVYGSGTGVNLGNFTPAYGGFWVDLERGGRNTTTAVVDFQGKAHIFCKSDDGHGSIWQVSVESQTIGDTTFIVPIPTKIIGSTGSNAARSITYVENDVIYINPKFVGVLGNEPGVLNVLRTNELSSKIRPYIRGLTQASMNKVCAYYYDAKVLISVPTTSGEPNRTIVFDRERASWYKDWTIGVSQFGEFTDSAGTTHLLGISGNKLIKFSENYQGDSGTAFTWRYVSPRLPVSDDWTQFAKIKKTYIRLRNTQGTVDFSVYGTGKNSVYSSIATASISVGSSDTGIGWDPIGTVKIGDTAGAPTVFAQESLIRYFTLNKLIRDIQFEVSGDSLADRTVLTGLMAEGFLIKTAKPADWKLTT